MKLPDVSDRVFQMTLAQYVDKSLPMVDIDPEEYHKRKLRANRIIKWQNERFKEMKESNEKLQKQRPVR